MRFQLMTLAVATLALLGAVGAQGAQGSRVIAAVVDFEVNDLSGDERDRSLFGRTFAENLETALVQSGRFAVVTRLDLDKVFEEHALDVWRNIRPETARELNELTGADVIIAGSITVFDERSLAVTVRFLDVSSGQLPWAEHLRATSPVGFFELAQRAVASAAMRFPIEGVVVEIDGEDVFINVGEVQGVGARDAGEVLRARRVGDLEFLDPIGRFRVVRSQGSFAVIQVEMAEGFAVARGDIARVSPIDDEAPDGDADEASPSDLPVVGDGFAPASVVAASHAHTLVVRADGSVWAWGLNEDGQVGDGSLLSRSSPVRVARLDDGLGVAAGARHSLALRSDGSVWAWGFNGEGQLGDGTSASRAAPHPVEGPRGVVAVAAGIAHSLALGADGAVWAWGANGDGQLGDGSASRRPIPVQVQGLEHVRAVAAGGNHSIALTRDGRVFAWGNNDVGQLGDGTVESRAQPTAVAGLTDVTAIAAGGSHSVALRADGSVWAWGWNGFGQVSTSDANALMTPTRIEGVSQALGIAAGLEHTVVSLEDGSLLAWGANLMGQVGDGSTAPRAAPRRVHRLVAVRVLAAGGFQTFAVRSDGSLWHWGASSGTLAESNALVPDTVRGVRDVRLP